jgi:hypothetical protein
MSRSMECLSGALSWATVLRDGWTAWKERLEKYSYLKSPTPAMAHNVESHDDIRTLLHDGCMLSTLVAARRTVCEDVSIASMQVAFTHK